MDALTMSFFELLQYADGSYDALLIYLTDFFGSTATAQEAIIIEDISF